LKKKSERKPRQKKGSALFNDVVKLTGIPGKAMRRELSSLLERKNIDPKDLTIDQLRIAAASYLKEIMEGLLEPETRSGTKH